MTKSTIAKERLEELASGQSGFNLRIATPEESQQLASMALAAMESEPHTDDELSNLLWYSQEATCHSDPNYYCEFQRLATPGLIAGIIRELQERRKAAMDNSESVELPLDYLQGHKDGLEWAAQLAEANHPETGDWLYDDPIELSKAIRKGPDMPPAQLAPVVPDGYVMVPKEPTEEMLQASYREAAVYSPTAYREMIAAAPQEAINAFIPLVSRNEQEGKGE